MSAAIRRITTIGRKKNSRTGQGDDSTLNHPAVGDLYSCFRLALTTSHAIVDIESRPARDMALHI